MKKLSNYFNKITLAIILILIVILGSSILMFETKNDKEKPIANNNNYLDNNSNNNEKINTYYTENFIFEYKGYGELETSIFDYDGYAVKFSENEHGKVELINISNNETITSFSSAENNDFFAKASYYIDKNLNIFTIDYDNKIESVVVEKFYKNGDKVDEKIVLNDFKGAISNNQYIIVDKLIVKNDYIYVLSSTNESLILQIFKFDGSLYGEYYAINDFDIDNNENLYISHDITKEYGYSGISKIDIKSKSVVYDKEIKYLNNSILPENIFYNIENDNLYMMNKKDVFLLDAKTGKLNEKILSF